MTRMTGKRALMEMLKAEGVEYIFGNPGTSESAIMDELEAHPELDYKLVLQEGVAMGMADAYARASGKPAFINLHIETGLANGISLLHNAKEGGTPLVLSAGNLDVREFARGRTDLAEMVRLFTKFTAEATHPEQIPTLMRRAFNEAKTPPTGPTFVAFSANSLDDEGEMDIYPSPRGYFRTAPDVQAVEDAARILAVARNPVIVVGDRVAQSGASAEAVRVAELVGAPVYSASYSEVNFPSSHPQYMGGVRLGFSEASGAVGGTDVVLAVGRMMSGYYMFSQPALRFFHPDAKLLHLDVDSAEVGTSLPTEVGLIADPKTGLAALAEALDALADVMELRRHARTRPAGSPPSSSTPVTPPGWTRPSANRRRWPGSTGRPTGASSTASASWTWRSSTATGRSSPSATGSSFRATTAVASWASSNGSSRRSPATWPSAGSCRRRAGQSRASSRSS